MKLLHTRKELVAIKTIEEMKENLSEKL